MIQFAEIVLPHVDKPISDKVKEIIAQIDDPFRIYFSISMLCTHGNISSIKTEN